MSVIIADPEAAVKLLAGGNLCAIPTETVYGLAADASNSKAVARIFAAKRRPLNHPLIVHVADLTAALKWVQSLPDWAEKLAQTCWPGPLTLVANRSELASDQITGGQDTVAVRVPNHPLTLDLLRKLRERGILGLVAPSANLFGQVSPTNAQHVVSDLGSYLAENGDAVLDGGSCSVGIESTIVLATGEQPVILRPGAITGEIIETLTGKNVVLEPGNTPRVSGALDSHYAPSAEVKIVASSHASNYLPKSGFIALAQIPTPEGLVRLASPETASDFASCLYQSMRYGDELKLVNIYLVLPDATGIGEAIKDRASKAAQPKVRGNS